MRKLTIGIATHDDYDGLYFTIQSIRMHHSEVLNDIEFVIIDNNPSSNHGKCIRELLDWVKEPTQYLPYTKTQSTTVKNKIFSLAETPYVLVIDSHVILEPGCIKKLIDYYDTNQDNENLLQGPLVYDDLVSVSTHFDLVWSSYMWGKWGTDDRGTCPTSEPFEIPAQGCGLFSCRKSSWLGFNPNFEGFGGEEGYIHEKFRQHNKKTICLPFLRWLHKFGRPNGTTYPNQLLGRYRNYIIGFTELKKDTFEVKNHFKGVITPEQMEEVDLEVKDLMLFQSQHQ